MPRPASAGRCASNWASPASGSSAETRREQVDDGRLVDIGPLARGLRVARGGLLEPLARASSTRSGCHAHDRAVRDQLGRQVDEVARDRHVLLVRPLLDVGGRAARLARRLQVAALELGERALREHREARDALDLVAEQLDAHGLGSRGREDVEDVAAHRELAAIADALDARVAGRDERRDGVVAHELSPALDVQRGRPARGRRDALDQRGRRDRDQPTGPEQPEPACALAHEMRRGLEARAVRRRRATARIRPRTAARTSSPRRPPRARSRRRRRGSPVRAPLLAPAAQPERREQRCEQRLRARAHAPAAPSRARSRTARRRPARQTSSVTEVRSARLEVRGCGP